MMKMMNRVTRVLTQPILHADDSLRQAVFGDDDRRMAFEFERVERRFDGIAEFDLSRFHQPAIAGDDAAAILASFDAEAWIDLELISLGDGQAAFASLFDYQLSDDVFGTLFGQRRHLQ
jgi:hypothetical protein